MVLNFEEVKDAGDSFRTSDRVAEDDGGLTSFPLQVIVHIQVFLFDLTANGSLYESLRHAFLISQVDNFWILGAELEDFAQLIDRIQLLFLKVLTFLAHLGLQLLFLLLLGETRSYATLLVDSHRRRADDMLDTASFLVLFRKVFLFDSLDFTL